MKARKAVASFDSATGMLRALSRFLAGRDIPNLGQFPGAVEPALSALFGAVNRLPRRIREKAYAFSGWAEAIPHDRVGQVRSDELAAWVAGHYPRRRYPAVFVGSSNGAMVHLAAALGAPWLPQTLLLPVRRRGVRRDDVEGDLRAGLEPARALLRANPDLALHHMHDPNQDWLMIAGMTYFRTKWLRLPQAYRDFLRFSLAPGGTLVVVDCQLRWPVTRVDDRYVFQAGALGGATVEEYHHGGPRVAQFLACYGSPRQAWTPPPPDEECPEAEWGFEPALFDDLAALAADEGWQVRVLRFDTPERLSPVVADLYRSWYADRGLPTDRLLVECFLLLEPWWTLRTGSVPFWAVFNTETSHAALRAYLDSVDPYDEIRLMLFSHGTDSIGLAPIEAWQALVSRGRKIGRLVGVDPQEYPRDFASLVRAHRELAQVRTCYPLPRPLGLDEVDRLLAGHDGIPWHPSPA